jgi:caffeoyl-CoA O-methyltransferase
MRSGEINREQQYVENLFAPEDDCLKQIRERLVNADRWGVNISAREGRILQILMKLSGVRRVVELGTLFGYSAVWMARALPEPLASEGAVSESRLYTIERDHECVRMAKKAFASCDVERKITLLEGEAKDCLAQIEKFGPFDMVFIDANKSAYVEYLEWASSNVRRGGLIVADNVLLGGGVVFDEKPAQLSTRQWEAMRSFNSTLADKSRFESVILPTSEGLSVSIRV